MDTIDKLDRLANLQDQRTLLQMDLSAKRDRVLAPVAAELAALADEYEAMFAAVDASILTLTDDVKASAIAEGETIRGSRLQAVFVKGRTSWNGRALDGYAAAHPEINQFRSVGDPSVTIRAVGGK